MDVEARRAVRRDWHTLTKTASRDWIIELMKQDGVPAEILMDR